MAVIVIYPGLRLTNRARELVTVEEIHPETHLATIHNGIGPIRLSVQTLGRSIELGYLTVVAENSQQGDQHAAERGAARRTTEAE